MWQGAIYLGYHVLNPVIHIHKSGDWDMDITFWGTTIQSITVMGMY